MNIIIWVIRIVVFLVLLALAIKNGSVVTLNFFFNIHWSAPLSVLLLTAFAIGTLLGLTANAVSFFANRLARKTRHLVVLPSLAPTRQSRSLFPSSALGDVPRDVPRTEGQRLIDQN